MNIKYYDVKKKAPDKYFRGMIPFLMEQQLSNIVGAEIGIHTGGHAEQVFKHLDMKTYYLIDPYENYPEYKHTIPINYKIKRKAVQRLSAYSDKYCWINKRSEFAIDDISEQLDFVYIDGNHSYPYVVKDLVKYHEIVKPNGWVTGHDYCIDHRTEDVEVKWAVDCFINKYDYILYLQKDSKSPDWWFQKKE